MATGGDNITVKRLTSEICGLCKEDGDEHKPGEKYCETCKLWLCSECVTLHKRFPSMRDHTLEDNSSTATVLDAPVLDEPCMSHPTSLLMIYCMSCLKPICAECTADGGPHESHSYIPVDRLVAKFRRDLPNIMSSLKNDQMNIIQHQELLNMKFKSAEERLRRLEKLLVDLQTEAMETNVRVNQATMDQQKRVQEMIKRVQYLLENPNTEFSMADIAHLLHADRVFIPEEPTFIPGRHDAGLRIILRDDLTRELKVDVLNNFICRNQTDVSPERREARRLLMLNEELTDKQRGVIVNDLVTGKELASLMKPEVRVVPGRDWMVHVHGSSNRRGVVLSELKEEKRVRVRWSDGAESTYAMGDGDRYELSLLLQGKENKDGGCTIL